MQTFMHIDCRYIISYEYTLNVYEYISLFYLFLMLSFLYFFFKDFKYWNIIYYNAWKDFAVHIININILILIYLGVFDSGSVWII